MAPVELIATVLEACDFESHLPFRGVAIMGIHLRSLWLYLFRTVECIGVISCLGNFPLAPLHWERIFSCGSCLLRRQVCTPQVFVCLLKHLSSKSGKDAHDCLHREAFFWIHWELESDISLLHHLKELLKDHIAAFSLIGTLNWYTWLVTGFLCMLALA